MRQQINAAIAFVYSCFCLTLFSCSGGSTPPITPAPDFSVAVAPTTLTLTAGATGQIVSVEATALNSFNGTVAVAITGLPAGITANPASLSLTPGTAKNLTITAAANATVGAATMTLTATSGTLSHTAAVALMVAAPPPSFSLSLSPTSATITAGATGLAVSVNATAANGFSGPVAVALTGLPAGVTANPSTLSLTPGTAQSTTLTAASSAAAGAASVTFTGTSGALTETATLALTVQAAAAQTNAPDITTYHDDVARDGLNAAETILTTANVNSAQFGKIGFDSVDGPVDAQPLYVANVTVDGTLHKVLYVATENDSVYAFDADSGNQLWTISVLASGEITGDGSGCTQIKPTIGITSTPVIDRKQGANGAIFVVGMTKDSSGNYHQRLHGLDLTSGAELPGSPTEIAAQYPGGGVNTQNGNVVFAPQQYAERAALLLVNGNIYTSWTSHCDAEPYSGWIVAYSESTLKQTQVLNLTPNGSQGSIWMSGDGPAADSSGNIYFLDANGTFDTNLTNSGFPSSGDFGNAIIKLSTSGTLAVADYFNVYNTGDESADDIDLGSGGEILLPDQTDSSGTVRQLVVGAGKDMNIYIADRNNMGKYNASGDSNIYQQISGALTGGVFSTPAYYNGTVYYGAVSDNLKAFPITNAKLATTASSASAATFAYPGTTPSISAKGNQNGIVWACECATTGAAILHAYDATNLANELYNSNQAGNSRDSFGVGNKYMAPLIINGKVYVGTPSGVAVFGLLSQ
jgi:hypothetical protein